MKSYNMVPARSIRYTFTIRLVLLSRLLGWTGTELGHLGAQEYADAHNVDTVFAFDANRGINLTRLPDIKPCRTF